MDKATYCKTKCLAKCCVAYDVPGDGDVTCPHLRTDSTCGIYRKRFQPGAPDVVQVAVYRARGRLPIYKPFHCGRIEGVLSRNELPDWVREQCCYAHPELLNEEG
jgi:hypothetical protein